MTEEKIKITNVQTIGRVVRSLQEIFPDLNWIRTYEEENTRRLPREQEYLTDKIKIILKCPKKHNVVRGLYVESTNKSNIDLVYEGLKLAGAI